MQPNFFEKYYPDSEYINCSTRAKKFSSIIPNQETFLELGVSSGENILNFKHAGWKGNIIGCDLEIHSKLNSLAEFDSVDLRQGDVRDVLPDVLKSISSISLLSIDLDGDIAATLHSLDLCKDHILDSYLYIDEFYNFDKWQDNLAKDFSIWLALNVESYDILFYTDNGVAIKLGGKHSADHLMLSLLEYTTENI
jgi:hypothetical protein